MICKTALNLSRDQVNIVLVIVLLPYGQWCFAFTQRCKYQDFFDNDEIETYSTSNDLIEN